MTLPKILQGLMTRHRKLDRFAAERAIVWKAFQDAQRRRDCRAINAASARLQAVTHAQLRAELGR